MSHDEISYLEGLPKFRPAVEWIWAEIDRVWDEIGLDNCVQLDGQRINDFYSHPVWLVNGVFTATDPISVSHREAIAKYSDSLSPTIIGDYGGGFGELARAFTAVNSRATVEIIEPYPLQTVLDRLADHPRVHFVNDLSRKYDLLIAQDVLEHVEDPIGLAARMASFVDIEGHIIFANCFYPFIKCHLPSTFHLRHTFCNIMKRMGLLPLGTIPGAQHAQVFRRGPNLNVSKARTAESLSKVIGPIINKARPLLAKVLKRNKITIDG
jgi:2-polyprenyl-6-hydroxyphenyl methylase/3-demethylubiquinone-9 3-methyltransferase